MLNHSNVDGCFRALAEPTRRAIVERLSEGPTSTSALAAPFNMTLAAVVQHLQVLEACGLVRTEKVGRVRTFRLEPAGFAPLSNWIAGRQVQVERQLDKLAQLLDEEDLIKKSKRNHERKTIDG